MRALLSVAAVAVLLAGCSDGGGGGDADDDADGGASSGGTSASSSTSSPTGGSMPGTGGAPTPQPVTLEVASVGAYPVNPAFDPSTATVPVGAMVHVVFTNEDAVPLIDHNWVVDGIPDAGSDTVAPGETSEFDFVAPSAPGTFAFYCSLGDHRDRGMEGTLTVA